MLILLPPSETKARGGAGTPLDLQRLAFPELTPIRTRLCASLVRLSRSPKASRAALGLSALQDAEIAANVQLLTSPTMPALDRYTGVLFDALDSSTLAPRQRSSLLIASALFGVLRADDPIPAYRLSGSSVLPRVRSLTGLWKPRLTRTLANLEPVIDLRSGDYARLAPLASAITVRVVTPAGKTVSHHNKSHKGTLARVLAGQDLESIDDVMSAAAATGVGVSRTGERSFDVIAELGALTR